MHPSHSAGRCAMQLRAHADDARMEYVHVLVEEIGEDALRTSLILLLGHFRKAPYDPCELFMHNKRRCILVFDPPDNAVSPPQYSRRQSCEGRRATTKSGSKPLSKFKRASGCLYGCSAGMQPYRDDYMYRFRTQLRKGTSYSSTANVTPFRWPCRGRRRKYRKDAAHFLQTTSSVL